VVDVRRFRGIGAADSHSFRSDSYVRMKESVRNVLMFNPVGSWVTYARRGELMQRLSVARHDTLGAYHRDALHGVNVGIVVYLLVPRGLKSRGHSIFILLVVSTDRYLLYLNKRCARRRRTGADPGGGYARRPVGRRHPLTIPGRAVETP
jgi:hypothetical protein